MGLALISYPPRWRASSFMKAVTLTMNAEACCLFFDGIRVVVDADPAGNRALIDMMGDLERAMFDAGAVGVRSYYRDLLAAQNGRAGA